MLEITPPQSLVTILKDSRFFEDLMSLGKLFQVFGLNTLNIFLANVS